MLTMAAAAGDSGVPEIFNVTLNIISVVVLLAGARFLPKYLKARDAQAQLAAKDKVILTYEQSVSSFETRVETLTTEVRECKAAGTRFEREAATWQAKYEEQSKYTAEPALLEVRDEVRAGSATTATALSSLGELVMKSNELLANLHGSFGFRPDDRPQ